MKRIFGLLIGAGLAGTAISLYLTWSGPKVLTTVEAALLPGTATVSGTVNSPKPFQAAKVYFRSPEKRMLYMVYTVGGHYQAMHLFPGNYEVSVKAKGLDSEVTKLTLQAGQNATVNVSLRESSETDLKKDVEYLPFDEIYPPGPGLAVAKKTCIYCHGENFLPARHLNAEQWNAGMDYMTGKNNRLGTWIQPQDMNQQEREALLQYLVQNFGPNSRTRAVKIETFMPVDETKLGKAMYIEYYFPIDPPGRGVNDPEYASLSGVRGRRRVGQDPQLDQDGNVWVTDRGYPNRICKLNPRTGEWKEYLTPEPQAGVHDLNIDKNGTVWVPENEGIPPGKPKLQAFNPKTEKWETSYLFNSDNVIPTDTFLHAQSIAIDSKQNIYAVLIQGNGLGKWNRETKKMTTYRMPSPSSMPYGVIVDKNDNVWIAESRRSKVVKLDAKTGAMTEFAPPTQPALIRRLNVDVDGTTIWFGLYSAGKLERLDQTTGKITEYTIPHQGSQPYDEVVQDNGEVWIADGSQGGALIKFNPKNETFAYFPSPQNADMPKIRLTREGAVWYSPRSSREYPGLGVLYPDITKITTLAAYRRTAPGGRWVGN